MSNSNWMNDIMNMLSSSKVVEPKVVEPVEKSGNSNILDMFASINAILGTAPMTPREQADSITTSRTASKTVVKTEQAELVYDTSYELALPDTNCIHYWHIPSIGIWQVGVCSNCNGEKWFSNSYSILMQEESSFNNSPLTIEAKAQRQAMLDIAALEKSLLGTELVGGVA